MRVYIEFFFIYLYKIISDKDMYRMLVANRYHKTI